MASATDLPFDTEAFNRARLEAGLSIAGVRRRCVEQGNPLSYACVNGAANGTRNPKPETVKALTDALGLDSVFDLYVMPRAVA